MRFRKLYRRHPSKSEPPIPLVLGPLTKVPLAIEVGGSFVSINLEALSGPSGGRPSGAEMIFLPGRRRWTRTAVSRTTWRLPTKATTARNEQSALLVVTTESLIIPVGETHLFCGTRSPFFFISIVTKHTTIKRIKRKKPRRTAAFFA